MSIRTASFLIKSDLYLVWFSAWWYLPKEGQWASYWTIAMILNSICNITSNLDEISVKEQATPPTCIINVLDWHLERRKKLLLKFNIDLARLWAEMEEQMLLSEKLGTAVTWFLLLRLKGECLVNPLQQAHTSPVPRVRLVPVLPQSNGFSFWNARFVEPVSAERGNIWCLQLPWSSGAVLMDTVTLRMTSPQRHSRGGLASLRAPPLLWPCWFSETLTTVTTLQGLWDP